jgi:hypothetical protein
MKAKITKIGIFTYLLLANNILQAQIDPDADAPAEPPTIAPINEQLIWLIVLGLVFAYYLYKTKKVKA